jgi:hypothetical protein
MGRPANTTYREEWYEKLLEAEETPKGQFEVLRGRLAADVKKLPEELQYGAYEDAVSALRGIIEAVNDALEDIGTRRPVGSS